MPGLADADAAPAELEVRWSKLARRLVYVRPELRGRSVLRDARTMQPPPSLFFLASERADVRAKLFGTCMRRAKQQISRGLSDPCGLAPVLSPDEMLAHRAALEPCPHLGDVALPQPGSVRTACTCGADGNLWVCLVCGHVACGRPRNLGHRGGGEGHAQQHFLATGHALAAKLGSVGCGSADVHCYLCGCGVRDRLVSSRLRRMGVDARREATEPPLLQDLVQAASPAGVPRRERARGSLSSLASAIRRIPSVLKHRGGGGQHPRNRAVPPNWLAALPSDVLAVVCEYLSASVAAIWRAIAVPHMTGAVLSALRIADPAGGATRWPLQGISIPPEGDLPSLVSQSWAGCRWLSCRGCSAQPAGAARIPAAFPNIEMLDCAGWRGAGVGALCSALPSLRSLRVLSLSGVVAPFLKVTAAASDALPSLEAIDVANAQLSVSSLCAVLGMAPRLTAMRLCSTRTSAWAPIPAACHGALAKILDSCGNRLEVLDWLVRPGGSSRAAGESQLALLQLTRLRVLLWTNAPVGSAFAAKIAAAAPGLAVCDLTGWLPNERAAAAAALLRALPRVSVVSDVDPEVHAAAARLGRLNGLAPQSVVQGYWAERYGVPGA